MTIEHHEKWKREAEFFNEKARTERNAGLMIPAETVRRYREARRPEFPAEYRFMALGSIHGKRVLDIGCGDGRASILLALLGAHVVGIDVSPDAIRLASERGTANGVGERLEFVCSPLETADFAADSFDVIWCDAFLHHVIPDLEQLLCRMKAWLKPDGKIVITEPVSLSPTFRKLRLALLPAPDATPDERPLEPQEIETIISIFPKSEMRLFGFLSRLARFVLPNGNYERASGTRQFIFRSAAMMDQGIFTVGLKPLASQVILHGQK